MSQRRNSGPRRTVVTGALAGGLAVTGAFAGLVGATPAQAGGGPTSPCIDGTTPVISTRLGCYFAGQEVFTVPAGSTRASFDVVGGSGGGGVNASGGSGKEFQGELTLPPATVYVETIEGVGGAGSGDGSGPGMAGGGSAVIALDAQHHLLSKLIIAGGGGGAGTDAPGGDAGMAGGSVDNTSAGGQPGDAATGGSGGYGLGGSGGNGQADDPTAATVASGGAGGSDGVYTGGGGGGGYAGGGGGGNGQLRTSSGGGAGSSYLSPQIALGPYSQVFLVPPGTDGNDGEVQLTFEPGPVVAGISPSSGPVAGGNVIDITGNNLGGATSVTVGNHPCGDIMAISPNEITCTVPAGVAGKADVVVSTPEGVATAAGAYSYVATMTPAPSPMPTPTPTNTSTPTSNPLPAPVVAPLHLALDLNLGVGDTLDRSVALLKGSGLAPGSSYTLTMHSKTQVLLRGVADGAGDFSKKLTVPPKACVTGGRHQLVLTGTARNGRSVSVSRWIVLDDTCHAAALLSSTGHGNIPMKPILFGYNSAILTGADKADLHSLAAVLRGAKSVRLTGYTQTDLTGAAADAGNISLAGRRVASIATYLKSLGVHVPAVTIASGPVNPVSTVHQDRNRRATVSVNY